MSANIFEGLRQTIAARLRNAPNLGLTVKERKGSIKLDKDTVPAIYVAPVAADPVGYCFGGVVIMEYSFDVVVVDAGDQRLDPPEMTLASGRVEIVRSVLDVGTFREFPTVSECRWRFVNKLYDASAISNNYDRTAMRFWYKSDETRSDS